MKTIMLRILLTFIAVMPLSSCEQAAMPQPLAEADAEYAAGNYVRAETLYQDYIRNAPQGDQRDKAWSRLLSIALGVRNNHREATALIEAMLLEAADNEERAYSLSLQLAEQRTALRQYEKAVQAYEDAEQRAGNTDQAAVAIAGQGRMHYLGGNYASSAQAYSQCLNKADAERQRAQCAYGLAENHVAMTQMDKAAALLESIASLESPTLFADEDVYPRAVFLLATIRAEQGRPAEARKLFTSILQAHPNPKVVEAMLERLE